jgi:hypothetical protein
MKSAKILACVACLFLCSTRMFAFVYTNQELGFSAKLPDGMADFSSQTKVKSLVSLGSLNGSKGGRVEIIVIQDLGAAIGREDLSKTQDKPQNVTLEKTAWKSFNVDLFKAVEDLNSISFVTLNVQIPLKPHAIQLSVSGPAADESKLRADMTNIVASIDGPTNWLTEGERAERTRRAQNPLAIVIGLIVLVVGRLRISRHYGLKGTGARVAGFFILVMGIAQPLLLLPIVKCLRSFNVDITGIDPMVVIGVWIAFYCMLIWGFVALLIQHYGNPYAKDADEQRLPLSHYH